MQLLYVTTGCCIRVKKFAYMLRQRGHVVHLATHKYKGASYFDSVMMWETKEDLQAILQFHRDADLIHYHNEPSFPVTMLKEVADVPVLFGVHDSDYWRDPTLPAHPEEDIAAEVCDGFVFQSQRSLDAYTTHGKPAVWVPSANPQSQYRAAPQSDLPGGEVGWDYQGGLVSNAGTYTALPLEHKRSYRNHLELFKRISQHHPVKAFGSVDTEGNPEGVKLVQHMVQQGYGLEHVPYKALLDRMGLYDWSLTGSLHPLPVWDYVLPNKFFESLVAGVPIVNFHIKEIADLIDEYGFGINVSSAEELLERWDEHRVCRPRVFQHRRALALDNFIGKLEAFYREFVGPETWIQNPMLFPRSHPNQAVPSTKPTNGDPAEQSHPSQPAEGDD